MCLTLNIQRANLYAVIGYQVAEWDTNELKSPFLVRPMSPIKENVLTTAEVVTLNKGRRPYDSGYHFYKSFEDMAFYKQHLLYLTLIQYVVVKSIYYNVHTKGHISKTLNRDCYVAHKRKPIEIVNFYNMDDYTINEIKVFFIKNDNSIL